MQPSMEITKESKPEPLRFGVYYDAEDQDLTEHRLPADRVADAIRQMHRLVCEADKTLNGKDNTIELFVSAPAEKGSLGIEFLAELINPQNAQLVLQALGLVSIAGGIMKGAVISTKDDNEPVYQDIFDVAQEINGATVIDVETSETSDIATLKVDGRELQCEEKVAILIENPRIRESVHSLIAKPIEGYANPSIRIGGSATQPITTLTSENIKKIERLLVTETEAKLHNFSATVTFTQVNFDSNKGWKMRLDGNQVGVEIVDDAFLKRINNSKQQFSKSDEYEVELTRIISYNKSGKEKTTYTLTKAKKKTKLQ